MTGGPEALARLAESTAGAIGAALEMFCPGEIEVGSPEALGEGTHPLADFPRPAVVTHVSYVDGVAGGNVFAMSPEAARGLAAALTGQEPGEDPELSEEELAAVGEAMKQMMASAAAATGAVLGQEVNTSPPEIFRVAAGEAGPDFEQAPYATRLPIVIKGEPCRLVQLVPNAFLVRMSRALEELGAEVAHTGPRAGAAESAILASSLADVPVRLWAELGRARMPAGRVVDLSAGTVVDLDRDVEEPVDLYVNGLPFARGRLVVTEGSDWAVQIETVMGDGS